MRLMCVTTEWLTMEMTKIKICLREQKLLFCRGRDVIHWRKALTEGAAPLLRAI